MPVPSKLVVGCLTCVPQMLGDEKLGQAGEQENCKYTDILSINLYYICILVYYNYVSNILVTISNQTNYLII